jgi:hypothetical protein
VHGWSATQTESMKRMRVARANVYNPQLLHNRWTHAQHFSAPRGVTEPGAQIQPRPDLQSEPEEQATCRVIGPREYVWTIVVYPGPSSESRSLDKEGRAGMGVGCRISKPVWRRVDGSTVARSGQRTHGVCSGCTNPIHARHDSVRSVSFGFCFLRWAGARRRSVRGWRVGAAGGFERAAAQLHRVATLFPPLCDDA